VYGESDADVIFGDAGDDMLLGSTGNDVLSGDDLDYGTYDLAGVLHGKDYLWQSMPKARIEWRSPAYA